VIGEYDAIVVGARCSGSAAATALARAGRRVVALDSTRFPSDTLSTHLLFAGGVAELTRLGALQRVLELGAPRMPRALVAGGGVTAAGAYTPVDGIDYGMCVRRTGLDAALVETACAAGAAVREGVRVKELIWQGRRVTGVVTADGEEIRAPLVVGADGRRSTVARLVGATEPYRSNPNGRACFFAYWKDVAGEGWRETAAQWRTGRELGTAFPCDDGLLLVLLMPPVDRAGDFAGDRDAEYDRSIDLLPELRARLAGCERVTKVRGATDLPSYFRRSSGPGWALPGDAGHFKDPVTAQGIRDAMRYGRLLGEAAAPVLDDPHALDAALAQWEHRREAECLEVYQWTNRLARGDELNALDVEAYRWLATRRGGSRPLLDVFSRTVRPSRAVTPARALALAARAFLRQGVDRRALARVVAGELRLDVAERLERRAARHTRAMAAQTIPAPATRPAEREAQPVA
jgi:flavin-dependent dehydrogenase